MVSRFLNLIEDKCDGIIMEKLSMNVIFHCPFELDENAKSASGIRPIKMLKAFETLGCNVDIVSGSSYVRKRKINEIIENIKNGKKYDFLYSESSTMPTALTDSHHLPLKPLLDYNFFSFLKKSNIPISLFYRDIYWMFENYGQNLNFIKKQLALFFYKFDLNMYDKFIDKIYLPSLKMGDYIKIKNREIFDELPPGHSSVDSFVNQLSIGEKLNILYIGGIGPDYQMHALFNAVKDLKNIHLTICTRENDWNKVKSEYSYDSPNIEIVHKSGKELIELYNKAHIAALFVKPQEYRDFAVPFKLFEYVGMNKPILCTNGTLVGDFVATNKIGWSLDYDVDQLKKLLNDFNVNDFNNKLLTTSKFKKDQTWEQRANKVILDMQKLKNNKL